MSHGSLVILLTTGVLLASAVGPEAAVAQRGGGGGPPIVLAPDDRPIAPRAPEGFNQRRDGVAQGRIDTVEYQSTTVGTVRRALVYLPPNYSASERYPVLYLLHGIGGDEEEWHRGANPQAILDNLIAEDRAVPMIVVMPNGRAQPNDRAEGNVMASAPAFARLERESMQDNDWQPSQVYHCPICGAPNPANAVSCSACGSMLREADAGAA